MAKAQKITPFLWFDGKAEEAMTFYLSIFKNGKVVNVMHHGEAGPGPKGSVLAVTFELEGQEFIGLNGGPHFQFTPAISMFGTLISSRDFSRRHSRFAAPPTSWSTLLERVPSSPCAAIPTSFG